MTQKKSRFDVSYPRIENYLGQSDQMSHQQLVDLVRDSIKLRISISGENHFSINQRMEIIENEIAFSKKEFDKFIRQLKKRIAAQRVRNKKAKLVASSLSRISPGFGSKTSREFWPKLVGELKINWPRHLKDFPRLALHALKLKDKEASVTMTVRFLDELESAFVAGHPPLKGIAKVITDSGEYRRIQVIEKNEAKAEAAARDMRRTKFLAILSGNSVDHGGVWPAGTLYLSMKTDLSLRDFISHLRKANFARNWARGTSSGGEEEVFRLFESFEFDATDDVKASFVEKVLEFSAKHDEIQRELLQGKAYSEYRREVLEARKGLVPESNRKLGLHASNRKSNSHSERLDELNRFIYGLER